MDEFNDIKNKNGFKVPDGYFNSFADKMAEMVKEEQALKSKTFSLKPILSMAAIFISVLVISWSVFSYFNQTAEQITNSEALAYLECNIDDISDDLLYESLADDYTADNDIINSYDEIDYLEEEITDDEIIDNLNY
jgi:Golgi nucleoside diphosphatase